MSSVPGILEIESAAENLRRPALLVSRRRRRQPWRRALVLLLSIGSTSCGGEDAPMSAPNPFAPSVLSVVDVFDLDAADVVGVSTAVAFDWLNSGVVADVGHTTETTQGQARLLIRSATGATVYDKVLDPREDELSQLGSAGQWTVTLILTDFSGTLSIRIRKG